MNLQKANVFLSGVVCLLLGGLIAMILLRGESVSTSEEGEPEEAKPIVSTVETEQAVPSDSFTIPREYSGIVQSARTMDIGFSRAGRIVEMELEVGDRVDKGEVIARLDTRRLEIQKEAYEEALDNPRSSPGPSGGAPVTQTDLDLVELDLEDSVLTSPFDGIATIRHMGVGSMASPGHPVVRLVERGNLEVLVPLPNDVAEEMQEGDAHTLEIGEKSIPGEVQAVLPEVDLTTRTRTVLFTIDENTAESATAGDVVRLRLDREEAEKGFWLPLSALTREMRGLWSVFAVEKEEDGVSRVVRRYLEVVHVEGDRARVRGMDAEPFEFISKGIQRVVPGQQVRIKGEVVIEEEESSAPDVAPEEAEENASSEGETTETEDAP